MKEPAKGKRVRSLTDQCAGTIQWVDPVHGCMGVSWDDHTTSQEPTGGKRRWELLAEHDTPSVPGA